MKKIFLSVVFLCTAAVAQKMPQFPFLDTSLTVTDRVDDLVSRMTLDEKIGQMMNAAPAIERLGIPEYNWWNECLHGVARAGLATVFPQAIGLGATWDQQLMMKVADAISDEARAKHHEFVRRGKRYIYQGLTFWSPNINIFRDPRWGRGQETYGEDPFLTGKMAVQFIKGLQGDDPKYFKVIATVKHFAVHDGPEPERHFFDAEVSERDFRETYLPQFKMGVLEGGAYSVMCAYNRLYGDACCGSSRLLTQILRKEWGFEGYVVSDCGAIGDIYQHHKIVNTPEEAAALAVKSGTDLECATTYTHLKEAVKDHLITEQQIDISVKRLFTARMKLGMFDPPDAVRYTKIPYSVVDDQAHHELALQAARESIVLLKNKDHILPLSKKIKTVAVIGPNADDPTMLLGNYNGIPSDPVTPLRGIREKLGSSATVLYAQGSEVVKGLNSFTTIPGSVLFRHNGMPGLNVNYYNNNTLTGDPLFSAVDSTLDADWKEKAPRNDMNDDDFGVRWTGVLRPQTSGKYQLGVVTTCRTTLKLNDSVIAYTNYHFHDEYGDPRLRKADPVWLEAGKTYSLEVIAGETYADAQVHLVWMQPEVDNSMHLKKEALAIAKKADVVIMCMGLNSHLEGEEMPVDLEGFRGGDRTKIALPAVQENLIKEVAALGTPVVLVLLNGSALAVNWEKDHIPAIVEAWYTGQAGGTAIADVLFGDYNPAGRLPVTFYKSVDDLPPFEDYAMAGHTYRYFTGETLYPFGYGLSYTTFSVADVKTKTDYKIGDTVTISATVKNTGSMAGDEVVQVYVSDRSASVPVPIRALKGFRRIHLNPGEAQRVEFALPPEDFSVINEDNNRVNHPGTFEISIGNGQPGGEGSTTRTAEITLH